MADCLIAFGANQGDPAASFDAAVEVLKAVSGINVVAVSLPVTTQPIGGPVGQPPYLNASVRIETTLPASDLHQSLIEIEMKLGRERRDRWGPRKIDLDLLLYDLQAIETNRLIVPHPRMSFRRFVLEPALEIAGDMIHPTSGLTIKQLLDHLNSRPKLVGWVFPDEQLMQTIEADEKFAEWEFMPVNTVPQLANLEESAKLVIVGPVIRDASNEEGLIEQAVDFAGPLLDLRQSNDPAAELCAALAACG